MTTPEEMDRRVAELRGWEWEGAEVFEADGTFFWGVRGKHAGPGPHSFHPTSDARQAMVLLEEIADVGITKEKHGWEVRAYNETQEFVEGVSTNLCEAIVRAYIAYMEAKNAEK